MVIKMRMAFIEEKPTAEWVLFHAIWFLKCNTIMKQIKEEGIRLPRLTPGLILMLGKWLRFMIMTHKSFHQMLTQKYDNNLFYKNYKLCDKL